MGIGMDIGIGIGIDIGIGTGIAMALRSCQASSVQHEVTVKATLQSVLV